LTSTFFTCAAAGFGTFTVSTQLAMKAWMASALTPAGGSSERPDAP
jgi:hypothetical protein